MVMETHRQQPSPPSHINQLQYHNQHHGSSILNAGSSNFHQMPISPFQITKENSSICGHNSASHKQYEEEDRKRNKISPKLMPASEPRSMQKTVTENSTGTDKSIQISPRLQNQQRRCRHVNASTSSVNIGSNTIRVCADCNTTTTPLWRSGPRGPKSLCNACGIRRRKQRKVMAEVSVAAANGLPVPDASSTKNNRRHKKEKKPLVNQLAPFKNKSRSAAGVATCTSQVERKLSFEDFTFWTHNSAFRQAFPRDEVADAAVLLMELSCGFAHL